MAQVSRTSRSKARRPRAIIPLEEDVDSGFIRMLVYGDPGVGKTTMIGTGQDTLILEADPQGTASARISGSKADKWPVRDHDDLLEVYEYLRHGGTDDYRWCWLDSLSLFQDFGLHQIMVDLKEKKAHRQLWLPDKGEYGQNMNRIKLWVREMADLPIHFGVTCHAFRYEDDDGRVTLMPWVQGRNMPENICGYMRIVAHMYARTKEGGKTERAIRTNKTSKVYAKDHYGAIPDGRLRNPTIPEIERLISERLVAGSKPSTKRRPTKRAAKKSTKRTRKVT